MENKAEYYECIASDLNGFTLGKKYKIINPNNIEDICNFIDDNSDPNGFSGRNYKYFIPVFEYSEKDYNTKSLARLLKKINNGK